MDDAKTHQALDAIADLFLTSSPSPATSSLATASLSGSPVKPVSSVGAVSPSSADVSRGARLAPKPSQSVSPWHQERDGDRYIPSPPADMATSGLYRANSAPLSPTKPAIRDAVAESRPDKKAREDRGVEVVFLASLPGLSGPWLTQYANYLLDHHEAVGLIRLDDQQFELQRVSRHPASSVSAQPALRLVENQPINDIERQLFSAGPIGALLVQPVDTQHPDAVAQIMAASRWTVLCGGYEAAVKDAQRVIGQLLELGPIPHRHRLGLMMMGCDAAKARQAAEAINRGLSDRLTGPIEMIGHQMQMVPVNVRTLGVWDANDDNLSLLMDYLCSSSSSASESQALPAATAMAATSSAASPAVSEPVIPESDLLQEAASVATIIPAHASPSPKPSIKQREYRQAFAAEPPAASLPIAASSPPPASVPVESPRAAQPVTEESTASLSDYLSRSLPGAIVLQARCPKHPAVEMMLDQQGRLHLLASALAGQAEEGAVGKIGGEIGGEGGVRSVVVDLLEARRWLTEHMELIRLTQRQCRFDEAAPAELHLFTDQSRLAAGLAASLSGQLRVHLLQTVTVAGSGAVTACADLN